MVLQAEKPKSRGSRAWQCGARPLSSVPVSVVTIFQGHGAQLPCSQDSAAWPCGPCWQTDSCYPVRKVLFASWFPILTEQVLGVQLPGASEGGTEIGVAEQ